MEKNALTTKEIEILSILCRKAQWKNVFTERHSDRDFDVHIFAEDGMEARWKISSSMYLAMINIVNWKDERIWGLTDAYGEKGCIPSQGHDWSGIRDSSLEAIWKMTNVAVEMLEEEKNWQQRKMDDAARALGGMFATFETKEELMKWANDAPDPLIVMMANAYVILKHM